MAREIVTCETMMTSSVTQEIEAFGLSRILINDIRPLKLDLIYGIVLPDGLTQISLEQFSSNRLGQRFLSTIELSLIDLRQKKGLSSAAETQFNFGHTLSWYEAVRVHVAAHNMSFRNFPEGDAITIMEVGLTPRQMMYVARLTQWTTRLAQARVSPVEVFKINRTRYKEDLNP